MLKRLLALVPFLFVPLSSPVFAAQSSHIVFMIGEDEYQTWETLPAFAADELRGYRVTIIHADAADKNHFPGLIAALRDADLLFVSVRRRTPIKEELDAVRAFLAAGKPLVGIRTTCHAFSPLPRETITDPRLGMWTSFDPEVLGGNYTGHLRGKQKTTTSLAPGAGNHPILRQVAVDKLVTFTTLYNVSPLAADATPLLIGTVAGHPSEPVAWTRLYGPKQARIFFTSLGGPEDLGNPAFRRLLVNGIGWALAR